MAKSPLPQVLNSRQIFANSYKLLRGIQVLSSCKSQCSVQRMYRTPAPDSFIQERQQNASKVFISSVRSLSKRLASYH